MRYIMRTSTPGNLKSRNCCNTGSRTVLILICILMSWSLVYSNGKQQFAHLGNFSLEKGGNVLDCRIGYRCIGELNSDSSNVILFPTWFGGVSENILNLLKPKKLIDPEGYFIIVVDALGNGVSSSPSSSLKQPDSEFPEITIGDMVESQYLLLKREFRLNHIYAIIGGSMGSMQVFEWSIRYPEYMDKIIPYVCTPKLQSPDLLLLKSQLFLIESGLECGMSEDEILSELHLIEGMAARTPDYLTKNIPPDEFNEFYKTLISRRGNLSVYDWRIQVKAMLDFDITREFNGSMAEVAGAVKAKSLIIVSESDQILNPAPALQLAAHLNQKPFILKNNCGHLGIGCEIDKVRNEIMRFLEE